MADICKSTTEFGEKRIVGVNNWKVGVRSRQRHLNTMTKGGVERRLKLKRDGHEKWNERKAEREKKMLFSTFLRYYVRTNDCFLLDNFQIALLNIHGGIRATHLFGTERNRSTGIGMARDFWTRGMEGKGKHRLLVGFLTGRRGWRWPKDVERDKDWIASLCTSTSSLPFSVPSGRDRVRVGVFFTRLLECRHISDPPSSAEFHQILPSNLFRSLPSFAMLPKISLVLSRLLPLFTLTPCPAYSDSFGHLSIHPTSRPSNANFIVWWIE